MDHLKYRFLNLEYLFTSKKTCKRIRKSPNLPSHDLLKSTWDLQWGPVDPASSCGCFMGWAKRIDNYHHEIRWDQTQPSESPHMKRSLVYLSNFQTQQILQVFVIPFPRCLRSRATASSASHPWWHRAVPVTDVNRRNSVTTLVSFKMEESSGTKIISATVTAWYHWIF